VTGGTGFFGTWLLHSWAYASDQLSLNRVAVVLTRDPELFRRRFPQLADHRSIDLLAGDVLDPSAVIGSFDACIHAATAASLDLTLRAPRVMFDTVVRGTENVLEWLSQSGAIPVLLTSSGAVYGPQPREVTHVEESFLGGPDPLDPAAVYGEAKRAAEMLLSIASASGGPVAKIARCFAFVGAHLPIDAHFAAGNFVRDALNGGPIVVGGDGTPMRSYLDASDLIVWLWTVLANGAPGRAYNVGSDLAVSISELATLIADVTGGVEVDVRGTPLPGELPARYVPSVDRARKELGLEVRVPLAEAVRRMLDWHRQG
jgi:nucleoside-diphosphate-sugar epimerase